MHSWPVHFCASKTKDKNNVLLPQPLPKQNMMKWLYLPNVGKNGSVNLIHVPLAYGVWEGFILKEQISEQACSKFNDLKIQFVETLIFLID